MFSSLQLLPPLPEIITYAGDPVRGAGWYGRQGALHTIAIRALNFRGRLTIQACETLIPIETDWRTVLPAAVPYFQYPLPGYIVPPNNMGETSNISFSFLGNVVWLRASVDRRYLILPFDTPLQIMPYGAIDSVMVNY